MTNQQRETVKYLNEFIPKEVFDFEGLDIQLSDAKRVEYLEAEYKQVLLRLICWLKEMNYSRQDIAECIVYFAGGRG